MFSTASVWFDLSGSLAIIFVLALVYGQVQRWLVSRQLVQILLGIAFGGVAWLQMHLPFEPMDGLIIDLRNIPLVLCGAFLGWRASLICFAIAALTRISIGGIGMESGVLGMMIAVCAGGAWSMATRSLPKRHMRHMVLLSVFGSFHLVAAFILPEAARVWFLSNASVPIALVNLLSITLAASLLDAEQRKIKRENRLAASAAYDPDHGALTKQAFEREILLRVTAGTMSPPAALLVINLRYADVLFSIIPSAWRNRVLGLVRLRLTEAFENADLVCSLGTTALVIPLSEEQLANNAAIQSEVVHLMRSEPFQFSDSISKLVTVETRVQLWPADKSLENVMIAARFRMMPKRKDKYPWSSISSTKQSEKKRSQRVRRLESDFGSQTPTEALFNKAAYLMKSSEAT